MLGGQGVLSGAFLGMFREDGEQSKFIVEDAVSGARIGVGATIPNGLEDSLSRFAFDPNSSKMVLLVNDSSEKSRSSFAVNIVDVITDKRIRTIRDDSFRSDTVISMCIGGKAFVTANSGRGEDDNEDTENISSFGNRSSSTSGSNSKSSSNYSKSSEQRENNENAIIWDLNTGHALSELNIGPFAQLWFPSLTTLVSYSLAAPKRCVRVWNTETCKGICHMDQPAFADVPAHAAINGIGDLSDPATHLLALVHQELVLGSSRGSFSDAIYRDHITIHNYSTGDIVFSKKCESMISYSVRRIDFGRGTVMIATEGEGCIEVYDCYVTQMLLFSIPVAPVTRLGFICNSKSQDFIVAVTQIAAAVPQQCTTFNAMTGKVVNERSLTGGGYFVTSVYGAEAKVEAET